MSQNPRPVALLLTLALALGLLAVPAAAQRLKPSAIEGRVLDQDEQPLAGAKVTVTRTDLPDFRAEEESNRKGRFTVRLDDGGGIYRVHIELEGFDPLDGELEVEDGMRHQLTFRLAPEGTRVKQQAVEAAREGIELYQAGDRQAALARLEEAVAADPELPVPHLYLADLYLEAGEAERAKRAIEIFRAHDPETLEAVAIAFDVYRALDESAGVESAAELLRGSRLARGTATRVYNEGVAANRRGDADRAVADFRLALSLDPELTAAYPGLAAVLFNRQQLDEALAVVDKLLQARPQDSQGLRLRYLILDAQGSEAAAGALEAYAAVQAQEASDLLFQQGKEAFQSGALKPAIAKLAKVVELEPQRAEAHYQLGVAYNSAGEKAAARRHLERFLELAPEHPEAEAAREILRYL